MDYSDKKKLIAIKLIAETLDSSIEVKQHIINAVEIELDRNPVT